MRASERVIEGRREVEGEGVGNCGMGGGRAAHGDLVMASREEDRPFIAHSNTQELLIDPGINCGEFLFDVGAENLCIVCRVMGKLSGAFILLADIILLNRIGSMLAGSRTGPASWVSHLSASKAQYCLGSLRIPVGGCAHLLEICICCGTAQLSKEFTWHLQHCNQRHFAFVGLPGGLEARITSGVILIITIATTNAACLFHSSNLTSHPASHPACKDALLRSCSKGVVWGIWCCRRCL